MRAQGEEGLLNRVHAVENPWSVMLCVSFFCSCEWLGALGMYPGRKMCYELVAALPLSM